MEPKYRTLIQAAALAVILALVISTHEAPTSNTTTATALAVDE